MFISEYELIPNGAKSIKLLQNGGTCCDLCAYSWVYFKIVAKFDTGFNHTLWESSWYDYDEGNDLITEVKNACDHYGLAIDFSKSYYYWEDDENSERVLTNGK